MNAQRRKQIQKAIGLLSEARAILEEVTEEEQEAFDNMPDGLQASERGETMEENIYRLEEAVSAIEEQENEMEEVIGG